MRNGQRRWLDAEFLDQHKGYTGDGCLIWPHRRNNFGYGEAYVDGKMRRAHRVMCELAHGAPPTPKHYAAHSCGNGHIGCVNPKHLSWKTPSENQRDTVRHGRAKKPGTPRQTIPDDVVRQIREMRPGKTLAELSSLFGIKTETIRKIAKGEIRSRPHRPSTVRYTGEERARLIARARRLRSSGTSIQRISENLGVGTGTVRVFLTADLGR